MDERKKNILHALIKDYIVTAEPVGSRTLAKKYDLGVSPATIRNELSDLEEGGYIMQPHTSAGRIPSDKGYRYYVDCIMPEEKYSNEKDAENIRLALHSNMTEMDVLLRQSCKLLSQLTNYTAVVLKPNMGQGLLVKVNILQISPMQILIIMINDAGMVYHKVLELPEPVDQGFISELESLLNKNFVGHSISQISTAVMREMALEMISNVNIYKQAFQMFEEMCAGDSEDTFLTSGALNMLNQPEFKDPAKIKNVLEVLEHTDTIHSIMDAAMVNATEQKGKPKTGISIGDELDCPEINHCSVVTAPYSINGQVVGTIGVLGPTRMDYAKVVSLVDLISQQLTDIMSKK